MNEGSPNCDPADAANSCGDCWGAGGCKKPGEQENRMRPRKLRCLWKELIQWAQRPAPSQTQNVKFLNLMPDLWCSDCLLPSLQTCKEPEFPSSLEQFSQSYWDAVARAKSPKLSHQIKSLSTLRLWLYGFSRQRKSQWCIRKCVSSEVLGRECYMFECMCFADANTVKSTHAEALNSAGLLILAMPSSTDISQAFSTMINRAQTHPLWNSIPTWNSSPPRPWARLSKCDQLMWLLFWSRRENSGMSCDKAG